MRNLYLTLRRLYHVSQRNVEIDDCSVKDFIFKGLTKHGNKTALVSQFSSGSCKNKKFMVPDIFPDGYAYCQHRRDLHVSCDF